MRTSTVEGVTKVARGWFGGTRTSTCIPNCFAQFFDEFVGTSGSPGVHHMAIAHLQFQGIEILFSDHVDIRGHALRMTIQGPRDRLK